MISTGSSYYQNEIIRKKNDDKDKVEKEKFFLP